jgi:Transposase
VLVVAEKAPHAQAMPKTDSQVIESCLPVPPIRVAQLVTLGDTLHSWQTEIAAMWRFARNNGITEGFHTKREMISRPATLKTTASALRCFVDDSGLGSAPVVGEPKELAPQVGFEPTILRLITKGRRKAAMRRIDISQSSQSTSFLATYGGVLDNPALLPI